MHYDIDDILTFSLIKAVDLRDSELVENTLLLGADPNCVPHNCVYGHTPLHKAVAMGATDIVKMLVKRGADVNKENYLNMTTLEMATPQMRRMICDIELNDILQSYEHFDIDLLNLVSTEVH